MSVIAISVHWCGKSGSDFYCDFQVKAVSAGMS